MSILKKIKKSIGADLFNEDKEVEEEIKVSSRRITFEEDKEDEEIDQKFQEEEKQDKNESLQKISNKRTSNNNLPKIKMASEKQNNIFQTEGQLAIDLLQNKEEFVIQAALAGVKGEDLDILVEGDSVIIKGVREKLKSKKNDYQYILQECYWGPFSREVILPEEIKIDDVEAIFKNGILTIRLPKLQRERRKKVLVKVKD
jgi:HSP20 family protein